MTLFAQDLPMLACAHALVEVEIELRGLDNILRTNGITARYMTDRGDEGEYVPSVIGKLARCFTFIYGFSTNLMSEMYPYLRLAQVQVPDDEDESEVQ